MGWWINTEVLIILLFLGIMFVSCWIRSKNGKHLVRFISWNKISIFHIFLNLKIFKFSLAEKKSHKIFPFLELHHKMPPKINIQDLNHRTRKYSAINIIFARVSNDNLLSARIYLPSTIWLYVSRLILSRKVNIFKNFTFRKI
jgi:hypothetical protein